MATERGLRGLVAFSDPLPRVDADGVPWMPGHHGGIYQLHGGARYVGRGTARTLTFLPDNTVLPARSMQKVRKLEQGWRGVVDRLMMLGAPAFDAVAGVDPAGWLRDALDAIGVRRVRHKGNHEYAWVCGGAVTRRRTAFGLEEQVRPTGPDPIPTR